MSLIEKAKASYYYGGGNKVLTDKEKEEMFLIIRYWYLFEEADIWQNENGEDLEEVTDSYLHNTEET